MTGLKMNVEFPTRLCEVKGELGYFHLWEQLNSKMVFAVLTLSRLSCNDRDQQQVTDESIRDTLLDLANYAIMTVLEMDTPDESHATLYAYGKPIYTVGEDKQDES